MKRRGPKAPRGVTRDQVLQLLSEGLWIEDIADETGIGLDSVRWHIKRLQADGYQIPDRTFRRRNLDAGPLIELLERRVDEIRSETGRGWNQLIRSMRLPERSILRMKQSGLVSPHMADTICCRLGVPTVCIYPYEQMSLEISA